MSSRSWKSQRELREERRRNREEAERWLAEQRAKITPEDRARAKEIRKKDRQRERKVLQEGMELLRRMQDAQEFVVPPPPLAFRSPPPVFPPPPPPPPVFPPPPPMPVDEKFFFVDARQMKNARVVIIKDPTQKVNQQTSDNAIMIEIK